MKSRRAKKSKREEWSQRAQALVDRIRSRALPALSPASEALRRKSKKETHEMAHTEWVKWAQVVVDRMTAAVPVFKAPEPPIASDGEEKPGRGEWMKWAHVVIDRLTTAVRVYSKPPFEDVFMADKERQEKNARALDLLKRVHLVADEADTTVDSLNDLEHQDERLIASLRNLFAETLGILPLLSTDMQLLLKTGWIENCNGRLASEFFVGPFGHEPEGVGSGHAIHGRLAEALEEMLEREATGHGRHPRDELSGPKPQPRWQGDVHKRWGKHNARSLRSAGRVE